LYLIEHQVVNVGKLLPAGLFFLWNLPTPSHNGNILPELKVESKFTLTMCN